MIYLEYGVGDVTIIHNSEHKQSSTVVDKNTHREMLYTAPLSDGSQLNIWESFHRNKSYTNIY